MSFYYNNPYTDPYLNMAIEEYLFNAYDETVFHIWRNEKSVIVGKNQLLEAEIDLEYVNRNSIKIVRRFTGGGAVYQDLGNINFSFLSSNSNIHFDKYNEKIMEFLKTTYQLKLSTNERRAIFIDDLKISGSAQHIRGQKSVYHATLLFDGDLEHLNNSLQGKEIENRAEKYVKSVKSPTVNLKTYLPENLSISKFINDAITFFTQENSKNIILTEKELQTIQKIKEEKYLSKEWINKQ